MKVEKYNIISHSGYGYGAVHTSMMGCSHKAGFSKAEYDRLISVVKAAVTVNEILDEDAVFFHSTSKIPRYKFSKFCENRKNRRVLSAAKADVVVMNFSGLDDLRGAIGYFETCRYYHLPENFMSLVMGLQAPTNILPDRPMMMEVHNYAKLQQLASAPSPVAYANEEMITQWYNDSALVKHIATLQSIEELIKSGVRIVSDDDLNKQMSAAGFVINQENYDDVLQLLRAEGDKDFMLGLEMMANCNYLESKFYISLLLNAAKDRIATLRSRFGVNITNFLEFFQDIQYNYAPHQFITSLRKSLLKDGTLTDEYEGTLRTMMLDYINTHQLKNIDINVDTFSWKQ